MTQPFEHQHGGHVFILIVNTDDQSNPYGLIKLPDGARFISDAEAAIVRIAKKKAGVNCMVAIVRGGTALHFQGNVMTAQLQKATDGISAFVHKGN